MFPAQQDNSDLYSVFFPQGFVLSCVHIMRLEWR